MMHWQLQVIPIDDSCVWTKTKSEIIFRCLEMYSAVCILHLCGLDEVKSWAHFESVWVKNLHVNVSPL